MKLKDFKESLKKKAVNLREIKIGLKESQRTLFFNSFDREGRHHGYVGSYQKPLFTEEQLRRHKLANDAYVRCLQSQYKAYWDYRARHIAYSLFRGKSPEQIENNYFEGKWDVNIEYDRDNHMWITLQHMIDKHLEKLRVDNPPKTYYHEFVEESKEQYEKYFKASVAQG